MSVQRRPPPRLVIPEPRICLMSTGSPTYRRREEVDEKNRVLINSTFPAYLNMIVYIRPIKLLCV